MDSTIPALFDHACREFGDRPYLSDRGPDGWHALSFSQARELVLNLASALIDRGFRAGDAAVVMAEGRTAWVAAELAMLHAGGICVPISLKLLPEEIPFRVNHSGAKAIFFSRLTWDKIAAARNQLSDALVYISLEDDEGFLEKVAQAGPARGVTLFSFGELVARGLAARISTEAELAARIAALGPDTEATICYTSGTTGNPKGIVLTHGNYVANCSASVKLFQMPFGLRTLVILPIDHSFAHTVALYGAFFSAIHLCFLDSSGGGLVRNIPSNLAEVKPQFLLTVPSLTGNFMKKIRSGIRDKGGLIEALFHAGLEAGIRLNGDGTRKPRWTQWLTDGLPYLVARTLIFPAVAQVFGGELQFMVGGGALLDVKQQEFYAALGVPVLQGYGLTEATPIISANTRARHCFGTSGLILDNVELTIRNEAGDEVSMGTRGEIVIRGPSVMKGYWKNPEATAQVLRDGWLYTGDLGYKRSDGFLMVVGREKALLIAQDGEKYSPEEIEEAIVNTSGLVEQVMLSCDHRNYTVALVVADRDALRARAAQGLDSRALLGELERSLSAFKTDPAFAGRFPAPWCPSAFALLPEAFTEQNKMINSTLKMVRYRIAERWKARLDELYTDEGRKSDSPTNLRILEELLRL